MQVTIDKLYPNVGETVEVYFGNITIDSIYNARAFVRAFGILVFPNIYFSFVLLNNFSLKKIPCRP